jgi:pyruvate/2-oxoglutarate dehydrogenase complex dihydrolipoamide dehydrogenase (E3) component
LPKHLIIIGGSYTGLEFAQMYRRFGSEVTVIERSPHLIQHEDEEVSAAIKNILEEEGIQVHLSTECIAFKKEGEDTIVISKCHAENKIARGTHVLLAIGRTPNTHDLGLDKAGVAVDEKGFIKVDDQLRTSVSGIWALGDCNGKGAFTHTSYNDYEIVAANLLEKESRRVSDRITTYALFIDPPLGRAGITEREAKQLDREILVGKIPMTRIKRALIKNETNGFMKILVDANTKEILGAAVLGVDGDEVIHSILDVMYAKKPYTLLQHAVHIHPTVSEWIPTLLGALKPLN